MGLLRSGEVVAVLDHWVLFLSRLSLNLPRVNYLTLAVTESDLLAKGSKATWGLALSIPHPYSAAS